MKKSNFDEYRSSNSNVESNVYDVSTESLYQKKKKKKTNKESFMSSFFDKTFNLV